MELKELIRQAPPQQLTEFRTLVSGKLGWDEDNRVILDEILSGATAWGAAQTAAPHSTITVQGLYLRARRIVVELRRYLNDAPAAKVAQLRIDREIEVSLDELPDIKEACHLAGIPIEVVTVVRLAR